MRWTLAATALVIGVALPLSVDGQATRRPYAGLIAEVVGTCTVTSPGREARPLAANRQPTRIYVGDIITCGSDAYVLLELTSEPPEPLKAKQRPCGPAPAGASPARGCTTVEPGETFEVPKVSLSRRDGFSPAVHVFEPAAPWRADDAHVFAPAEDEYIRPGEFVIRFADDTGAIFSITLTDHLGNPIWSDDGVQPASGVIVPAAAREALARYRDSRGSAVGLYLTDTTGQRSQVFFNLLSRDEEQRLDADLAFCEGNARSIMLSLCRIAAYERLRAFNDVANAYDTALTIAPGSDDLLDNAITAHQRVGNSRRVNALKSRLPPSH